MRLPSDATGNAAGSRFAMEDVAEEGSLVMRENKPRFRWGARELHGMDARAATPEPPFLPLTLASRSSAAGPSQSWRDQQFFGR
ncbi:MAG TPA: hypothetical protein VHX37_14480 [Acidobacteriaceae bacterium]|jgi:hypothetical protein|nr:hypothetical protein [Acidobacteriaceae bacterium]